MCFISGSISPTTINFFNSKARGNSPIKRLFMWFLMCSLAAEQFLNPSIKLTNLWSVPTCHLNLTAPASLSSYTYVKALSAQNFSILKNNLLLHTDKYSLRSHSFNLALLTFIGALPKRWTQITLSFYASLQRINSLFQSLIHLLQHLACKNLS